MLLSLAPFEANRSSSAIGVLRHATRSIHERLHSHAVFASLQSGRIGRAEYVNLLLGLYGFHAGLKDTAADGHLRCQHLLNDLNFMGADAEHIANAPRLAPPLVPNAAARWGIDYVLRGAALGGRVLARKLDALLGLGDINGRRFFLNGGENNGAQWLYFVEQLEIQLPMSAERDAAAASAASTFAQFETWMTHIVASRPEGWEQ